MKHLKLFEKSLNKGMNYNDHIDQAVQMLNYSESANREESDTTHTDERQAIINRIMEKFSDKTEEDIVTAIIDHKNIKPKAVDDYMYYHHKSFPGHKATLVPIHEFPHLIAYGIHVIRRIEGNVISDNDYNLEMDTITPYSDIRFYDEEKQGWIAFRVADTDIYRVTKEFENTCISRGLRLIGGRKTEFEDIAKYLKEYNGLNRRFIEIIQQHSSIGWNEDKTEFINPRDPKCIITTKDTKLQRSLRYGYITKGENPTKNVNGMLNVLKQHPLAVAVYAAPFINVINDGAILDTSCITIDIFGAKGKGKNLIQYAAMNPMGSSREKSPLMRSFSRASAAGINAVVRFNNSHVICFEESHRAGIDVLEDVLYSVFNSTMGDKATNEGTSRDDGRYSSIIVASGESSIVSRIKNDGLTRRILPLSIQDILASIINDPVALSKFHKDLGSIINESYGIALDPFLDYCINQKDHIIEIFNDYMAKYEAKNAPKLFDYEKHKTLATYTACVHLVLDLLIDALDVTAVSNEDVTEICSEIYDYCFGLCSKKNKNIEALSDIYNFAVTNSMKHFSGQNKNHAQLGKFDKRKIDDQVVDCLCIVNTELKKLLNDMGYVADNTIDAWKETGVLHSQTENRGNGALKTTYSIQVKIGGLRPSCSILKINQLRELISQMDDSVEDTETSENAESPELENVIVNFPK